MALVLILLLALGTFFKNRWIFVVLLSLLTLLVFQDQMRLQPWVYMYFWILLPFALFEKTSGSFILFFQIILIGIYLWSGLHKLGQGFIETTFDRMLHILFGVESEETRRSLHWIGYSVPITEATVGVLLFFRKTRTIGIVGALGTHIIILAYLIKSGHNSVVYPWNIAMMIMVVILFYKSTNQFNFAIIETFKLKALHASAILFFLVMPAFNYVEMWDSYLSFKLYSGTNHQYCVGLDKDQYQKVDRELYPLFWRVENPQGKYWISVNKWAFEELNVAFYPSLRVFKRVAGSFCEGEIPHDKLKFVEFKTDFKEEGAYYFECKECD